MKQTRVSAHEGTCSQYRAIVVTIVLQTHSVLKRILLCILCQSVTFGTLVQLGRVAAIQPILEIAAYFGDSELYQQHAGQR